MPYLVTRGQGRTTARENHNSFLRPKPTGPFYSALVDGDPLSADHRTMIPTAVRVEKFSPQAEFCHLMLHSGQRILICHQRMVAKLEELEPGLHETFPLTIKIRDSSEVLEGVYFLTHVTEKAACFDEDKTRWRTMRDEKFGHEAAIDALYSPGDETKIVLKQSEIVGRHLWRGAPMLGARSMFCSDELADFVRAEELRGWRLIKCQ